MNSFFFVVLLIDYLTNDVEKKLMLLTLNIYFNCRSSLWLTLPEKVTAWVLTNIFVWLWLGKDVSISLNFLFTPFAFLFSFLFSFCFSLPEDNTTTVTNYRGPLISGKRKRNISRDLDSRFGETGRLVNKARIPRFRYRILALMAIAKLNKPRNSFVKWNFLFHDM